MAYQGRSELYVVLTIILCGTNFLIWGARITEISSKLVKGVQYDAAVDELEKAAEGGAGSREKDLEIESLQRELAYHQKFAGRDDRHLKEDITQLEDRNQTLEKELEDMERRLVAEQQQNDKLTAQVDELDQKINEMKRERDKAKSDIKDYQRQLESQRENIIMRRGEDMDVREVVTKKNKELSVYLDEIRELQDENDRLQTDVDSARKELEKASVEMNQMADDYSKLKAVLDDTDAVLENVKQERDILRAQVQDIQVQLQSKAEGDDAIMMALNKKVEEWKGVLVGKDAEIAEQQGIINDLQQQLQAARMDTDKNAIGELMQAANAKDEKIKELKQKLEEATRDMKLVTENIEEIKSKTKEGLPSLHQQKRILTLNQTLQQEQISTLKERERVSKAEQEVAERDRTITELRTRMMQYEKGQYGLSEAVHEIKDYRAQMKVRDKNIEELTKQINQLEIEMNHVNLENEELRERLGLDPKEPLDTTSIKKKKQVREEQALAMNRVLTKEVERLEEERLQLKKMLRKQAMHRGERAVELGLTTEDLEAVEQIAVSAEPLIKPQVQQVVAADASGFKFEAVKEELAKQEKTTENLKMQNKKLESENKDLKEENKQLEVGLREIHSALRDRGTMQDGETSFTVQVPAIDKLIAIIESKNASGQYDTSIQLKAQIEQLNGRNDELRSELRNAREELIRTSAQLERKSQKVGELEKEVDSLREAGQGVIKINPLQLPEGMTASSSDVIASLNEFLIQILQELSLREEALASMEEQLETYKRKFSVVVHQQSIMYAEYLEERENNQKTKKTLEEENNNLSILREQDSVKIQEFERLLENMNQDPDQMKNRIAELTRKLTVLRVNERSLARRYTILQEAETSLRKENNKLKNEVTAIEAAITQRVGYLSRYKEVASYKIALLQKALDDSVPDSELQLVNKQYNELTAKYRDLLQKENILIAKSSAVENLEFEVKRMQDINEDLKKELLNEKERAYGFEQSLKDLLDQGRGMPTEGRPYREEEVDSIARKLATLEMKELNERQRADHAAQRYERLRSSITELENRNAELEQRFAEMAKLNLEAQRVERELREELLNAVPATVYRSDRKRIEQLEESEAKLKLEVNRLKEIADVATHQTETVSARYQVQEKELISLRKQLRDIQMETDEKTIIAKLHQHIVAQQVSEATAVRKLESAQAKVKKLEAHLLKMEQQCDEKDQILYRVRTEARAKARFLKKTIQDLRRQFSGALPLMKQERFTQSMKELQNSKIELENKLNTARTKSHEAEERLLEVQIKYEGLQDLIAALKDGKGAQKVTEWHTRMGEMRLIDMKLKRHIEKVEEQVIHFEKVNRQQENAISLLEEENARQAKEYEDRQLVWEQHEVELERIIARLERQQEEMAEAAQKFEEATGSIPDPSLPVANQLEMAVHKIKEHIRTIIRTRAESKRLKENIGQVEEKLKKTEKTSLEKDKLINELRLRLPISEREIALRSSQVHGEPLKKPEEDQHAKQALKVAQTTIESLKLMLQKKDESITKYQDMLTRSREEMRSQADSQKREMKLLQDRLQLEVEENVKKLRKVHQEYVNAPQPKVATDKQLARLSELEEMVAEQDNALAAASEKYKRAREEINSVKQEAELSIKEMKKLARVRDEENSAEVKKLNQEIEEHQKQIAELIKQTEILNEDLHAAKEANERAPSKTMKALVERLRNQLAVKDKQQKQHARKAEEEINVQRIVEKQTDVLQARIEELQTRQEKLKMDLRKKREVEETTKREIEQLKRDNERKEAGLRKLAAELKEREDLQDQIETLRGQIRTLEKFKSEAERLRKRVQVLEEEGQTTIQPVLETHIEAEREMDFMEEPEKLPKILEQDKTPKDQKSREEVIRWEEGKKWQKKLETLKLKLKEKTGELEKVERSNQMMRDVIARNDKEKLALQSKLKSLSRPGETTSTPIFSGNKEEVIQGLKRRIFQLEEENNELQRQLALDRDNEMHELRIKNNQLSEAVRALESELASGQAENNPESYDWSLAREQNLQREMLLIRKENMELRFENEQAQKDVPRLKARVKDLEEYVDILKSEIETVKKKERNRKAAMGTGMGGQSVEDMERVIAAMRRVIERLQVENENLKKQTGRSKPQNADLARENRLLKQELQKLKTKETSTAAVAASTSKSTTKVVQENDRLRRDLKKEKDESEKLRVASAAREITIKKLETEMEKVKQRLVDAEARGPNLEAADGKTHKSVVMNKMLEEKVSSLQTELEKKNKLLQDIKSHIRSAAEKEAELLRKQDEYEEKIAILERFPSDIKSDSDLVQKLQQSRLSINRLEAEKKELLNELSRLRELTRNGETPADLTQDEILEKLRKYDRMLSTEVELRTKLKTVEIEKERMATENLKLKRELEAFDPDFFEELEDLKYNYKKSVERNVLYERQLKQLSRQFGVSVNIPDDDDY